MATISFNYLKDLFDETFDVGYLSAEQLKFCANHPIKQTINLSDKPGVANFTNHTHFKNFTNAIVILKEGSVWDYSHYDEIVNTLEREGLVNWFEIYINYKEAAIQSGLGVRARNSLVYSYKFGFDCKIACVGFIDEITDIPTNKRVNDKIWKRCIGCNDCYNACPVKAIHNKGDRVWIDGMACDNFLGYSDHPKIPSIKKFWHKNVHPEIPKDAIDAIQTFHDAVEILGQNLPWDKNGYTFDGNVTRKDGQKVNIPVCRECTSQPRCSKWNGQFPYEDVEQQKKLEKKIWKRGWTVKDEIEKGFKDIFSVPIMHLPLKEKTFIENLFAGKDFDELTKEVGEDFLSAWNCNLKTSHALDTDNSWVQEFISYIQPYVFAYIEKHKCTDKSFDVIFDRPWVNLYEYGDNQNLHNHLGSNNILSYSYFLHFPENSSKISFRNSIRDKNFHGQDSERILNIIDSFYEPEINEGDLVIFPSWLEHSVHKNKNNKRVTISGNIKIEIDKDA